jgi:hypothetical protein
VTGGASARAGCEAEQDGKADAAAKHGISPEGERSGSFVPRL